MNMTLFACMICFFFLIFSMAEALHGAKDPLWRSFSGMLAGTVTLLLAHLLEPLTGIPVTVGALTLGTAMIGGVPGALLIVFLNAFFL